MCQAVNKVCCIAISWKTHIQCFFWILISYKNWILFCSDAQKALIDASTLWVMEPKDLHASALPLILRLITYIGIKLHDHNFRAGFFFFFCFCSSEGVNLPQWWLTSNEGLGKTRAYLNQVPQDWRLYLPSEECGVNFMWKHLQNTPTHFLVIISHQWLVYKCIMKLITSVVMVT